MQVQPSAKFRGKSEEIKKRVPNVWGLIDLLKFLITVVIFAKQHQRSKKKLKVEPN